MTRILSSSSLLGTQSLLVDSQGNGDYTTIQEALNAAALYANNISRWSVRVAPGIYTESLVLKDYVDLIGLGPGRSALLSRGSGQLLIPATCTVANLWLKSSDSAIFALSSGFSGMLEFDNVVIDQYPLDIPAFTVAGGTLNIFRSLVAAGGAPEMSAGALNLYHSIVRNQAVSDGGANMVLRITHGALLLSHCLLENTSPAGYCVYIDNSVTSLKAFHTIFRTKDSTYAIHVSGSARAMILAACAGNAPLHPNLTGYHDYVYDSSL